MTGKNRNRVEVKCKNDKQNRRKTNRQIKKQHNTAQQQQTKKEEKEQKQELLEIVHNYGHRLDDTIMIPTDRMGWRISALRNTKVLGYSMKIDSDGVFLKSTYFFF